jgi:sec-independent protein translocase protein TatA
MASAMIASSSNGLCRLDGVASKRSMPSALPSAHLTSSRSAVLYGAPAWQPAPASGVALQRQQDRSYSRAVQCRSLFGLGLPELAVIAGIAALVFGPSKLPELGKGLGKTIKSFQSAAKEFEQELKDATKDGQAAEEPKKEAAKKE